MSIKEITVPDIGDFDSVEIIEILVAVGDQIEVEDSLITVESDKASMEIPSNSAGIVKDITTAIGDEISEGSVILIIEETATSTAKPSEPEVATQTAKITPEPEKQIPSTPIQPVPTQQKPSPTANIDDVSFSTAYASPSVRKFARELGVDLGRISGSGRKQRILRDDIKGFVKTALSSKSGPPPSNNTSLGISPMPVIDFSQFGDIKSQPLSKINKLTGEFLHRSWLTVPHVTQFDEADITEMEAFRKQMGKEMERDGIKITPLAFIIQAVVASLKAFPRFNSSLDASGEQLILKSYYNVGVAVDTSDGLVVPVIRDADKKSLVDISQEIRDFASKARNKKLKPSDMQGGCFTISSLGGIGGTKFTPIVNTPEVAILGVSRSKMQPEWNGSEFEPRLILPLSLSYDHRVIDGADGAKFTSYLSKILADIRRLLV
jgi:pyruvate dehydrogenase E2 component (dihydrolipoamide acetyltransferase)